MSDLTHSYHPEFQEVVEFLKNDIFSLRTGRATPQLLDAVSVEAYDARSPLSAVASISVPDARSLVIEPWDKSIVKAIEKGIIEAKLGLTPSVIGTQIRLTIPSPTEENRKAMVKMLGEKLEHARTNIRRVRDEARGAIQKSEKEGQITEDQKYKLLDQLDKAAAGMNEKIKHIGEEKEKEIMTI